VENEKTSKLKNGDVKINCEVENDLANKFFELGEYEQAFKLWLYCDKQGDLIARYNLSRCYKEGYGVEVDYEKAFRLMLSCANMKLPQAQFELGEMYISGIGVEIDKVKAYTWYKAAADNNHVLAELKVGLSYFRGDVLDKDYVKAFYYIDLASNQGLAMAQYLLAKMYMGAIGCEYDLEKAKKLLVKAARGGEQEAYQMLISLKQQEDNEKRFEDDFKNKLATSNKNTFEEFMKMLEKESKKNG